MQQYGLKITSPYEPITPEIIKVSSDMTIEETYISSAQAHKKYIVTAPITLTIIHKIKAGPEMCIDLLDSVEIQSDNANVTLICRGVAHNKAKIIYRSDLTANKETTGSTAHQKVDFLMLGDEAEVDAIPSLNIATSAIACSHALSVSEINPAHIWYTTLHGLNPREAEQELEQAFLEL